MGTAASVSNRNKNFDSKSSEKRSSKRFSLIPNIFNHKNDEYNEYFLSEKLYETILDLFREIEINSFQIPVQDENFLKKVIALQGIELNDIILKSELQFERNSIQRISESFMRRYHRNRIEIYQKKIKLLKQNIQFKKNNSTFELWPTTSLYRYQNMSMNTKEWIDWKVSCSGKELWSTENLELRERQSPTSKSPTQNSRKSTSIRTSSLNSSPLRSPTTNNKSYSNTSSNSTPTSIPSKSNTNENNTEYQQKANNIPQDNIIDKNTTLIEDLQTVKAITQNTAIKSSRYKSPFKSLSLFPFRRKSSSPTKINEFTTLIDSNEQKNSDDSPKIQNELNSIDPQSPNLIKSVPLPKPKFGASSPSKKESPSNDLSKEIIDSEAKSNSTKSQYISTAEIVSNSDDLTYDNQNLNTNDVPFTPQSVNKTKSPQPIKSSPNDKVFHSPIKNQNIKKSPYMNGPPIPKSYVSPYSRSQTKQTPKIKYQASKASPIGEKTPSTSYIYPSSSRSNQSSATNSTQFSSRFSPSSNISHKDSNSTRSNSSRISKPQTSSKYPTPLGNKRNSKLGNDEDHPTITTAKDAINPSRLGKSEIESAIRVHKSEIKARRRVSINQEINSNKQSDSNSIINDNQSLSGKSKLSSKSSTPQRVHENQDANVLKRKCHPIIDIPSEINALDSTNSPIPSSATPSSTSPSTTTPSYELKPKKRLSITESSHISYLDSPQKRNSLHKIVNAVDTVQLETKRRLSDTNILSQSDLFKGIKKKLSTPSLRNEKAPFSELDFSNQSPKLEMFSQIIDLIPHFKPVILFSCSVFSPYLQCNIRKLNALFDEFSSKFCFIYIFHFDIPAWLPLKRFPKIKRKQKVGSHSTYGSNNTVKINGISSKKYEIKSEKSPNTHGNVKSSNIPRRANVYSKNIGSNSLQENETEESNAHDKSSNAETQNNSITPEKNKDITNSNQNSKINESPKTSTKILIEDKLDSNLAESKISHSPDFADTIEKQCDYVHHFIHYLKLGTTLVYIENKHSNDFIDFPYCAYIINQGNVVNIETDLIYGKHGEDVSFDNLTSYLRTF